MNIKEDCLALSKQKISTNKRWITRTVYMMQYVQPYIGSIPHYVGFVTINSKWVHVASRDKSSWFTYNWEQ